MTAETDPDRRPRTVAVRFRTDDRARIPFALIAVLLLVSSVVIVSALETRPDPQPRIEPSLAMDRTDAAIQTAVRDAIVRATDRAGQRPITEANATNAYGSVLAGANADETFRNYLRATIYLETENRLANAGQEIRGVETTVSVPPVETPAEFEAGIDRVDLVDVTDGVLTVAIDDVTTTVERDGERIAQRTDTIEVSVSTALFQLHERVGTYEEKLNAGITESGFGQQFNARLYAIGWARGWGQYGGLPITEVIANRHVVPSANSATYQVQEDVFGTRDPAAANAMTQGWLCMAIQDSEELYGGYKDTDGFGEDIDGNDICDGLELLYGSQLGDDAPDEPSVQDLLGNAPGMDEEETIAVNESAYLPLRHMIDGDNEHSIESAIDRVFTVEVESDASVRITNGSLHELDPPVPGSDSGSGSSSSSSENWSLVRLDEPINTETDVTDDEYTSLSGSSYGRYEATVTNTYWQRATWVTEEGNRTRTEETDDTTEVEITFRVTISEADHSMGANVDAVNANAIRQKYAIGDGGGDYYSVNYNEAPEKAERSILGTRPRNGFLNEVEAAASGERPEDVADEFSVRSSADVDLDHAALPGDVSLETAIVEDITKIQADVENVSVTFERSELITQGTGESPFYDLIDEIEAYERTHLERRQPYANVAEKAVYEARMGYFELLKEDVRSIAATHDGAMEDIDDELEGANSGLTDAVAYLRQGTTRDDPGPGTLETPALVSNVHYEISGSPTYLVTENVTQADVPPVGENVTFAPMAAQNRNYLSIPYDSVVTGILSKIPKLGLGDENAELTLRVAGEALQAIQLTEEITGEEIDRDSGFENEIRGTISNIENNITSQTINYLAVDAETAEFAVENAVQDQGDSIDERAVNIGNGSASGEIADQVVETIIEENAWPADEYNKRVWEAKAYSVIRPLINEVVSHETVEVDEVENVEALDQQVRDKLEKVSTDVIEERLNSSEFELNDDNYGGYIDGTDTPNRVPAGLPITPVPGYWFATMNVWDVNVSAEYARFEATANTGTPAMTSGTTYVRENATVTMDIDGREQDIGTTDSISLNGRSIVVVVVPPGGTGVGDRTGVQTECSETWPEVGPVDKTNIEDCAESS